MVDLGRNWPEILEDLEKSGMSVMEYSRKRNIPYSTLIVHRNKSRKLEQDTPESVGFVRVSEHPLRQNLSSGVRIRIGWATIELDEGFSEETLSEVLEVLRAGA